MAAETSNKRAKRKRIQLQKAELDRFESLPWNSSLSEDNPFSLVVGSNELEGGFLSLEEIDEAEYGLQIPKPERESRKETSKRDEKSKILIADNAEKPENEKKTEKKKKRKSEVKKVEGVDGTSNGDDDGAEAGENESEKSENDEKKKKRRKKKKKNTTQEVKKVEGVDGASDETEAEETESEKDVNVKAKKGNKKKVKKAQEIEDAVTVSNGDDEVEEEFFDDADYYAWNELRLNPLIMKSIHRLGFCEPTPIQRACIPAAAHQGKDVVGAAETGSGKTLAFGLPIFQRLLDEREKAVKMEERGEEAEKYAPKSLLRALIITPTRELALQVTEHLKAVSKDTNFRVVPIVGGMSQEKQARLLKLRPEVVVGTPGRLWSLMSGGDKHLTELHSLSFFVLDEADRMIENGHFHELQSIVDMLPMSSNSSEETSQDTENCVTVSSIQRKKRQTFVFSATIALSSDFRKKLKRGTGNSKKSMSGDLSSIESLSERAGMRDNVAIIDLTNDSIMANKLEESFIECREEDKDAYLYYILSVHGEGRTIVFCTSVAALRHLSSIMRTLGINLWTLHAQMEQRARLKAIDRFRENEHAILLATDVAARGIDIPGVRTVVHYQLPHSAEVYVHRSGRTARASAEGCSIALVAPNEKSKFATLYRSFSKESFQRFPLDSAYMPEVMKRLSLARQIDKISRKDSKEKAKNSWLKRNAESIELDIHSDESDDEIVYNCKQRKATSANLKNLKQELNQLLSRPLQPKTFSKRYWAGAGVTPLLHHQFQEMSKQKQSDGMKPNENKRRKMVVIGQDCVEPLQALRTSGQEVHMNPKETVQKRKDMETLRRKRKDEKTRLRDHKRKQRKMLKGRQ